MMAGGPPFFSENIADMNDKILHSPLRFPPYFDNETKHLLQGLLSKCTKLLC